MQKVNEWINKHQHEFKKTLEENTWRKKSNKNKLRTRTQNN